MTQQKNYDSEFCGNLAIHQTNSIQDYGCLLVLDVQTLNIVQGSENVSLIVKKNIKDLVGQHISVIIAEVEVLKAEVAKGIRSRVPLLCNTSDKKNKRLHLLVHVQKDLVILEIEEHNEEDSTFSEIFQQVRSFISVLERTENLKEICQASIQEIRRIAGFDGIRMYQFDEHWNGTVIAEEITGKLESYLGQTFPASDVPKQARALYKSNPYRLIPNRAYQPYPLFPVINPIVNGFLNLSDCNLRSVAAVHLEYMANMNVSASMSIRVMVDGELWGLISCHHITTRYLSNQIRSIFEWLSMEISYRISSVLKEGSLTLSADMFRTQSAVKENIFNHASIEKGFIEDENKNLLKLFNSTGFAVNINGKISAIGITPKEDELENLFIWASGKTKDNIYATHELANVYEEAEHYQEAASGTLIIPIGINQSDMLICFRGELIKQIKWGGNPNEAIKFDEEGKKYHPRNSFKLWQQTVRGQSAAWTAAEIDSAKSLRDFLLKFNSEEN